MQISRALACRRRLQILRELACQREITPTSLARKLRTPLPMICTHLRRLMNLGLIQRRRSGSWSYCVARSYTLANTFPASVANWLFPLQRNPQGSLAAYAPSASAGSHDAANVRLQALIFEIATAFANVRRLQLLRTLLSVKPALGPQLTHQVHMSPAALIRHGRKLVRRGYMITQRQGMEVYYTLTPVSKSQLHAQFWAMVQAEWKRNGFRS